MSFPKVGIGVLIFNNQKMLLGERQQRHGQGSWGPPGGHLEFGETFEACAVREVAEETGLHIASPQFIAITNDVFSDTHYVSIFLAASCQLPQCLQNRETNKTRAWEWFDKFSLPDNLFLPLRNLIEQRGLDFIYSSADVWVQRRC